jgi:hypothetical protein
VFPSRARGVLRCSAGPAPAAVDIRCLISPMVCRDCCAAPRGSVFHCLTSVSRVWRTSAIGTETQADGAAVLVPVAGGSGGDHPSRFQESLGGWPVG